MCSIKKWFRQHALTRRPSRSAATTTFSTEVFYNEVVPASLASIASILRTANEIEYARPRVSYLCRFYAFEKAQRLDPASSGRGVRQFKISLLKRLERDNALSVASRVKKSDAQEIESFYQQYKDNYVRVFAQGEQANRAQLAKAYKTVGVLFEVLCAVNKTEKVEAVAPEVELPTSHLHSFLTTTTFSTEVFPTSLASIAPILRTANEIEHDRPRVSYLCRFYAFEKAHRLDPTSSGSGVRQFKISLLVRLERDSASSLASRVENTDAQEIESFYQQFYEHYVRAFVQGEQADRAQLGNGYETAGVLFEVLCSVNKTEKQKKLPLSYDGVFE